MLAALAILVALFTWWFTPESVKSWAYWPEARIALGSVLVVLLVWQAIQRAKSWFSTKEVLAPKPYSSRSVRTDEDPMTAQLAASIGGISGPSLPRMILRRDVPAQEAVGWDILRLDDGRECVWTGPVSDRSIQDCVLMAKKPINRNGPVPLGFTRCFHCGFDNPVAMRPRTDLSCSHCGALSKYSLFP